VVAHQIDTESSSEWQYPPLKTSPERESRQHSQLDSRRHDGGTISSATTT